MGRAAPGRGALERAAEGMGAKDDEEAAVSAKAGTNETSEEVVVRNQGPAERAEFRKEACWAESEAETARAKSERNRSRFICILRPIERAKFRQQLR